MAGVIASLEFIIGQDLILWNLSFDDLLIYSVEKLTNFYWKCKIVQKFWFEDSNISMVVWIYDSTCIAKVLCKETVMTLDWTFIERCKDTANHCSVFGKIWVIDDRLSSFIISSNDSSIIKTEILLKTGIPNR